MILIIVLLLLMGCGQVDEDGTYQQIYSWQDRELVECIQDSSVIENEEEPLLIEATIPLLWMARNISYVPDISFDYWQTSCETLERKEGDCEDQAILLWRLLREQGFSDKVNKLGCLKNVDKSKKGHVIGILHLDEIYALNPTIPYQRVFSLDFYLQQHPYYYLAFEFNLNSIEDLR